MKLQVSRDSPLSPFAGKRIKLEEALVAIDTRRKAEAARRCRFLKRKAAECP